jgi:3-dehydroquinate dehydratase-2
MAKLLIIHGPNLNLLGQREPEIYGKQNLGTINTTLQSQANELKHELTCKQSNAEHEIITLIQHAKENGFDFIIINPAAFSHTSIAIRDAFLATQIPFIEVHLSNVFSREGFRHHSYLADIAVGIIAGFGADSYSLALMAANRYLTNH